MIMAKLNFNMPSSSGAAEDVKERLTLTKKQKREDEGRSEMTTTAAEES